MNVLIHLTVEGIDWAELATVYERAPLGRRDPERLKRAYEQSYRVCFVFDRHQLVGAARMLSDGEYYAAIYDVVVLPEYQGCGIGTKMMTTLLADLSVGSIILFAVPGKEGFYKKLGFAKLKTGMGRFQNAQVMKDLGYIE